MEKDMMSVTEMKSNEEKWKGSPTQNDTYFDIFLL